MPPAPGAWRAPGDDLKSRGSLAARAAQINPRSSFGNRGGQRNLALSLRTDGRYAPFCLRTAGRCTWMSRGASAEARSGLGERTADGGVSNTRARGHDDCYVKCFVAPSG
jgi:hypothetical protein